MILPNRIDQQVVAEAERVRLMIQDSRPELEKVPDSLPPFILATKELRSTGLADDLPRAVPYHPPVPLVGRTVWAPGSIKLGEVLKLQKPVIQQGRSTIHLGVKPRPLDLQCNEAILQDLKRYPVPFAVNLIRVATAPNGGDTKRLPGKA